MENKTNIKNTPKFLCAKKQTGLDTAKDSN